MEEPEQAFSIDASELPDRESLPEFGERLHVREQYDEVVAFIREMDPKYSTVLLLYFAEELTGEQIAKLLGISKNTVYTRLRRGKQQVIGLGNVNGKNSITSTLSTSSLKRSIQHELTHNLGGTHENCTPNQDCVLKGDFNKWCDNCREAIKNNYQ